MKSKRKAIRSLAQNKVVDITDYRSLQQGKESVQIALISDRESFVDDVKNKIPKHLEIEIFDSRFSFEQSLKNKEWDAVLIDELSLGDEAMQVCEKLKRQMQLEEVVVFILSESKAKDRIRKALEKGCDEWISRPEDVPGIFRLMSHYLHDQ